MPLGHVLDDSLLQRTWWSTGFCRAWTGVWIIESVLEQRNTLNMQDGFSQGNVHFREEMLLGDHNEEKKKTAQMTKFIYLDERTSGSLGSFKTYESHKSNNKRNGKCLMYFMTGPFMDHLSADTPWHASTSENSTEALNTPMTCCVTALSPTPSATCGQVTQACKWRRAHANAQACELKTYTTKACAKRTIQKEMNTPLRFLQSKEIKQHVDIKSWNQENNTF